MDSAFTISQNIGRKKCAVPVVLAFSIQAMIDARGDMRSGNLMQIDCFEVHEPISWRIDWFMDQSLSQFLGRCFVGIVSSEIIQAVEICSNAFISYSIK